MNALKVITHDKEEHNDDRKRLIKRKKEKKRKEKKGGERGSVIFNAYMKRSLCHRHRQWDHLLKGDQQRY